MGGGEDEASWVRGCEDEGMADGGWWEVCGWVEREGKIPLPGYYRLGLGVREWIYLNYSIRQCFGSMTVWCGSGSADPCL